MRVKASEKKRVALQTCKRCEYRYPDSRSQCPSCGQFNFPGISTKGEEDTTILLSNVARKPQGLDRLQTGPWDHTFGGGDTRVIDGATHVTMTGIATTSTILLGGTPGAGKSTLCLQLAAAIAGPYGEVLYIGTEETEEQILDRADRLGIGNTDKIRLFPMGSSADLGSVLTNRAPKAIMVDSLPGLIQDTDLAVEFCKRMKEYCAKIKAPAIIIDHVNKEGDFAGLMALQHEVDTLMVMRCIDKVTRELSPIKNRFGPTDRSVLLDMTAQGLVAYKEVSSEERRKRAEEFQAAESEDEAAKALEASKDALKQWAERRGIELRDDEAEDEDEDDDEGDDDKGESDDDGT